VFIVFFLFRYGLSPETFGYTLVLLYFEKLIFTDSEQFYSSCKDSNEKAPVELGGARAQFCHSAFSLRHWCGIIFLDSTFYFPTISAIHRYNPLKIYYLSRNSLILFSESGINIRWL